MTGCTNGSRTSGSRTTGGRPSRMDGCASPRHRRAAPSFRRPWPPPRRPAGVRWPRRSSGFWHWARSGGGGNRGGSPRCGRVPRGAVTADAGSAPAAAFEFRLAGPGGEPVHLWRTCMSHGLTELPPMRLDAAARMLELTLPINGGRPRLIQIGEGRAGFGVVRILGPAPGPRVVQRAAAAVRHVLRLDERLAEFYALAAEDADLAWACAGAGRLIRSPTVFEDVVKTICTTNCSWALTRRMITGLVEHLGEPAPGAPARGWIGRAFPGPEAMADARPSFYKNVVRAGYRGPISWRWRAASPAARSISNRSAAAPARRAPCRTKKWPSASWIFPASDRMPPRTS